MLVTAFIKGRASAVLLVSKELQMTSSGINPMSYFGLVTTQYEMRKTLSLMLLSVQTVCQKEVH